MNLDISNKLLQLVDIIISFINRDELFKDINQNEKGNYKNIFQDHLATILSIYNYIINGIYRYHIYIIKIS